MIYSHDIPSETKLYFGKRAKLKREIEAVSAEVFENNEFDEIVTPYFSYHQQEALDNVQLIKLNDPYNKDLTLRGDSSVDVIRLIIKRLKSNSKKWFYIQPVFRYPTKEINQIGAEILEGVLYEAIKLNKLLMDKFNIKPIIQISNIKIIHILEKMGISTEDLQKGHLENFAKIDWLKQMSYIHSLQDLQDLSIYPEEIRVELLKIKDIIQNLDFDVVIAPLFYANFNYYDGIFYRFFINNVLLSMGGEYEIEGIRAVGFSIYTDNVISSISK
ncbi:MAG: ATP phosphoribosyltransferase regulatory subunit [Epsilonproteobacteria bacterium]|nr:ATP phosphoribosyltransferase regulatory subunit [Campylobacterota bacterium]